MQVTKEQYMSVLSSTAFTVAGGVLCGPKMLYLWGEAVLVCAETLSVDCVAWEHAAAYGMGEEAPCP